MANSLYRRDISRQEIKTIINFSYGLGKMIDNPNLYGGHVLYLGTTEMLLPTWYRSINGWQLSCHRIFKRDALGIERHTMSKLAKYLGIRTQDLVRILYNCSMISVVPHDESNLLHSYTGTSAWSNIEESGYGYVLEKRRALSGFVQSEDRQQERIFNNPEVPSVC